MTAKTAATTEGVKEKKPRGRKPGAKRGKSGITTGAQARSSAISTDPEGQAILSTLAALRNLDNEARLRVMGYVGQRYGVNQQIGNTEQRSMAAGA